jgi:hypothetical protein
MVTTSSLRRIAAKDGSAAFDGSAAGSEVGRHAADALAKLGEEALVPVELTAPHHRQRKNRGYGQAEFRPGTAVRVLGMAWARLATAQERCGEVRMGIISALRAYDLGKEAPDHTIQADALTAVGRSYLRSERVADACDFLRRALRIWTLLDNELMVKDVSEALAHAHMQAQEVETAQLYTRRAAAIGSSNGELIETAQREMSDLRRRLVGANAAAMEPMYCERVLPNVPTMRRDQLELDAHAAGAERTHAKSITLLQMAQDRVKAINDEIERVEKAQVLGSKIDSSLVHGEDQIHDAGLLREKINVLAREAAKALEKAQANVELKRVMMSNMRDERDEHRARLAAEEGPLAQRVAARQGVRCICLNRSNELGNDVSGRGTGCIPHFATSSHSSATTYSLDKGRADTIVAGDVGRHVGERTGHSKAITALGFYDTFLYTGSIDCTVRKWHTRAHGHHALGECAGVMEGHTAAVWAIAADARRVVTGAADSKVRVWSAHTLQCLHTLHAHFKTVRCVHLDHCGDGATIATGGNDKMIWVWDSKHETPVEQKKRLREEAKKRGAPAAARLFAAGRHVATGDEGFGSFGRPSTAVRQGKVTWAMKGVKQAKAATAAADAALAEKQKMIDAR